MLIARSPLLLPDYQSAKRSFKSRGTDFFSYITNEVNGTKGVFYFSHKDLKWKEPAGHKVHFMVFVIISILLSPRE